MKKCDMSKPYVFVSYKREDSEIVINVLEELQKKYDANIWIDTELKNKAGYTWNSKVTEVLAQKECKCVLFFMSDLSMMSGPILAELYYCKFSKKVKRTHSKNPIKIIPICLSKDYEEKGLSDWVGEVLPEHPNAKNEIKDVDIIAWNEVNLPKEYSEGNDKMSEISEIASVIAELIFEGKGTLTHISPDADLIYSNIREYDGVCSELSEDMDIISTIEVNTNSEETEELVVEEVSTPAPNCPIYYIKGAKYEAYLTYEDDKYTVLKGSKIAENWKEWAGTKNINLHADKVGENYIMLEDAEFNTISAVAKFVKGTSTDGGGVFVEKNLVTEIKPVILNEEKADEANSDTKKKSASITGDITYTLYGKEHTDNQANMMLRVFAQVLKRHPEQIATLPEQAGMNCAMKYEDIKDPGESSAYPTYFRSCRNFTFPNGESICIGTAYSSGDKMKKIARLLDICGEDRSIFYSEQIELPEAKAVKVTEEGKVTTNVNGLRYSVYGDSFIGDQTDMMTTICSKIIERHPDKLQAVVDGTLCAGYKDADTMAKTYFRVYREFTCNGTEYVIGTSFGMPAKIKEIEKVLYICGEDASNIEIEGVELNVAPPVRKGRTKVETDNFFDD